jgi:ribosomal protein S18 acetylase RimI-like enzyme
MTTIRPAMIEDAGALAALEKNAFDCDFYHLMNKSQISRLIKKGNADILVAEENEGLIGMVVILYRKTSKLGRLYSIAVHPDFQGRDVGKKLFEAMEARLKEKDLRGALLEIRADNIAHLERYQKLEYLLIRIMPDYYPDGCAGLRLERIF